MNGIQTEHILDWVEQTTDRNRGRVREELTAYLSKRENQARVLELLEKKGEASIPTSIGPLKLTTSDLAEAATA